MGKKGINFDFTESLTIERNKLLKENKQLHRVVKRFLKWDNLTMDWANTKQWDNDIKYAEKILKKESR